MNKKDIKKGLIPYFFLLLIVLGVIYFYNISNKKINNLSYEQFKDGLDNSDITEVVITPRSSAGVYESSASNNFATNCSLNGTFK